VKARTWEIEHTIDMPSRDPRTRSVLEQAQEVLAGEEAWVVGGAVRDELLGRELVDLDIATREPERAARAYAKRSGGAPFPLSERHGAWRVALDGGETVDFTPLPGSIEDDLATRDFTINAIARPLAGGGPVDPFGGQADLEERRLRAVGESVFGDDPLRLLRAVRLEDELDLRLDEETERLVREHASLAGSPAGERILAELRRLSPSGYRRLDGLGLLQPLGGRIEDRLDRWDSPDYRLVAVFGEELRRFPISNELRRHARALVRAERPDDDPRSIHRFRRATEPWALEALAFLGASELTGQIEQARSSEPAEPLLRGDELELPPGPEIGRLLAQIEEERAAGTIATKEEALDYARRHSGAVREDG
jgi:tRNA nucleotidyltransferase/poly(A) polymerase